MSRRGSSRLAASSASSTTIPAGAASSTSHRLPSPTSPSASPKRSHARGSENEPQQRMTRNRESTAANTASSAARANGGGSGSGSKGTSSTAASSTGGATGGAASNGKRGRAEDSEYESTSHTEVYVDQVNNCLVTSTTQPLFYTDPLGQSHLVRLQRLHFAVRMVQQPIHNLRHTADANSTANPRSTPIQSSPRASPTPLQSQARSAAPSPTPLNDANTAAPSSSSLNASPSPAPGATSAASSSATAAPALVPPLTSLVSSSEVYVRSSDLCAIFLMHKHALTNFVRDFNQPYEKSLLRLSRSPKESYCLTRRGVRRFMLTKKVRSMPALGEWIEKTLLVIMRPGNENMAMPKTARPRKSSAASASVTQSDAPSKVKHESTSDSEDAPLPVSLAAKSKLPQPSQTVLSKWITSTLSALTTAIKAEDRLIASQAAVAAAMPASAHSEAGRNWDSGTGRFEGRQTRVGVRYQANLPATPLSPRSRANDLRPDDELIYDPKNPRQFFAPFAPQRVIHRDDPNSRRAAREKIDKEIAESRRTTRAQDAEASGNNAASSAASAAAQALERQLLAAQRIESTKNALKLEVGVWNKLKETEIVKERGATDFEITLMAMFITPGTLQQIFTHRMPNPATLKEPYDIIAKETFVPTARAMITQREDLDAEMAAFARTHTPTANGNNSSSSSSISSKHQQKRKRVEEEEKKSISSASPAASTSTSSALVAASGAAHGGTRVPVPPRPTSASANSTAAKPSRNSSTTTASSSSSSSSSDPLRHLVSMRLPALKTSIIGATEDMAAEAIIPEEETSSTFTLNSSNNNNRPQKAQVKV